jgi:hypothetical protein
MAIARVNSATGTTAITFASPVTNYLQMVFAFRDGSNTAPTVPTPPTGNAWTVAPTAASGANTCSSVLVYRYVASASDTGSGTFTNATSVIGVQYSGIHLSTPIGNDSDTGASSNSVNFNAVTFAGGATGWAAGFVGHRAVDGTITTAPSGMTNVTSVTDATDQAALHDTNGTVSGWSTTSASLGGTSSGYRARVIEIRAAGSTYTLTAATGSFALTGTATGLTAARLLTATSRSYALTGNAAGLLRGVRLTAATGSFALTGTATNFLRAVRLIAGTGAFSLTGQSAGLLRGVRLTAASGTFSFTGNAATLTYTPFSGAYTLPVDTGSFSFTGNAATLTYTPVAEESSSTADIGPGDYTPILKEFKLRGEKRPRLKKATIREIRQVAKTEPTQEQVEKLVRAAIPSVIPDELQSITENILQQLEQQLVAFAQEQLEQEQRQQREQKEREAVLIQAIARYIQQQQEDEELLLYLI